MISLIWFVLFLTIWSFFYFLANFLNFEIIVWYHDIFHLACVSFYDQSFFFEFLKFWNNCIIYSNCKMHLLLQLWSDSFQISYRHQLWCHRPGYCLFEDRIISLYFWRSFLKFWNSASLLIGCSLGSLEAGPLSLDNLVMEEE